MMKKKALTLLLALVSLGSLPLGAQQAPPPQDEVIRVNTNLVQVDVVVTDKDGKHVTDLRPEDFEVLEDKRKQQISNFSYVETGGGAPPSARAEGDGPAGVSPPGRSPELSRRTIAIVVDDLGISFESMVAVREALKRFVSEQMQPTDRVAVILTSKSVGALQQFTSDKNRLNEAIEAVRWYPGGHGGLSPFELSETQQTEEVKAAGEIGRPVRESGTSAQVINDMEAARAANYTIGTFNTLGFVMRGLAEMPGRKAVIMIAESFRLFTSQGRNVQLVETLRRLTDQANLASTVIYTVDASGLNPLTPTASSKVVGLSYTFDPQLINGPRPNEAPSTRTIARGEGGSSAAFKNLDELMSLREHQNIESQSVLSYLANRTGGLFTRNTNNLSLGTERALEDQRGYYLIGYQPEKSVIDPSTGRRRFHDLTVRVKRPGLRVRSREGYYGVTGEEARAVRRTRDEHLVAALTSPFSAGGIDVRLTPLFFDDREAGSYVRALLHIDTRNLTFTELPDGSRKTALDIVAVNFGENGRAVEQFSDTQTITVPAGSHDGLMRDGLSFVLNVPVKQPGSYQLRIAVRDGASERVGAAGQYIEIPDLGRDRLTLSGIVLGSTEPKVVKTSTAGAAAVAPFSPALRRVRQGMTVKYDYVIYNATVDPATNQPQLETQMRLLRDGKQVFTGTLMGIDTSRQTDLKRINAGGCLRIGPDFAPGQYVLQVIVKDSVAQGKSRGTTVSRSIDFEIVD